MQKGRTVRLQITSELFASQQYHTSYVRQNNQHIFNPLLTNCYINILENQVFKYA